MRLRTLIPAAAALVALATAPAASADTLVAPTPEGSQNLAAAGGWMAWAQPEQPAGSGCRIALRAPDGTVSLLDTPVSAEVPDPSFGSLGGFPRRQVLTYSREGDIYTYDLVAKRERRVARASSPLAERAPSVANGTFTFVRLGGRRAGGIFRLAPSGRLTRLNAHQPREMAFNGSRVAYTLGTSVLIARVSGEGRRYVIKMAERPQSLIMNRYRATWVGGREAFKTQRFGGSGTPRRTLAAESGAQPLPAGTNSIAFERDRATLVLDREGVKRLSPTPFGSRG